MQQGTTAPQFGMVFLILEATVYNKIFSVWSTVPGKGYQGDGSVDTAAYQMLEKFTRGRRMSKARSVCGTGT
jgi:hypothetical protein